MRKAIREKQIKSDVEIDKWLNSFKDAIVEQVKSSKASDKIKDYYLKELEDAMKD